MQEEHDGQERDPSKPATDEELTAQLRLDTYFDQLQLLADGNKRIVSGSLAQLVQDAIIEIPRAGEEKRASGGEYTALDALEEMQFAYNLGLRALENSAEPHIGLIPMAQQLCTIGFTTVSARIAELSLPPQTPKK